MIKYRDHRGSFAESKATLQEFNNLAEIGYHLERPLLHLTISYYGKAQDKKHLFAVQVLGAIVGFIEEDGY